MHACVNIESNTPSREFWGIFHIKFYSSLLYTREFTCIAKL